MRPKTAMSRRPLRTFALAGLLALGGLLGTGEPAGAIELTLTLDQNGLTATGVTPGATVAWTGAWRYRHPYWTENGLMDERVTDDDQDGIVTWPWTWEAGRELPYAGVFLAVDLSSGSFDVVSAPRFPLEEVPVSGLGLALDGSAVEVDARELLVLTVRPGNDAWMARPKDGGPSDAGPPGRDRKVRLEPGGLQARHGAGPAPQAWATGDLLFGIDTETLRYFAVEVP